jgi:hypothetical protein
MPMTQTGSTPNITVSRLIANTTGQTTKANDALTAFAICSQLHVKSRTTATAPGSPAEGDAYILPSGHSGYASGASTDDVCFYSNGWQKVTPLEGWRAWVEDEDVFARYSGTNWVEANEVGSVEAGLTASTTQTQGQGALTKVLNQVSTCANANDVRTLPAARKGLVCVIANDGAQTLQVFPASGDKIDAGATDASTTIAAGKRRIFYALDGTTWISVLGA